MDVEGNDACKYALYYSDWLGWDLAKFRNITNNLTFWHDVEIRKIIGSALDCNWAYILDELERCNTYDELHTYVKSHYIPEMDCFVSGVLTAEDRDRIDMVALHYRPSDIDQNLVPVKVYGDGNCFPEALATLLSKLRIVMRK